MWRGGVRAWTWLRGRGERRRESRFSIYNEKNHTREAVCVALSNVEENAGGHKREPAKPAAGDWEPSCPTHSSSWPWTGERTGTLCCIPDLQNTLSRCQKWVGVHSRGYRRQGKGLVVRARLAPLSWWPHSPFLTLSLLIGDPLLPPPISSYHFSSPMYI